MPHPILLFVVFLILVVAVGIYAWRQAEKRRQALRAWARAQGLRFRSEKDPSFERRHPRHEALQKGSNRYACHIMTGERSGRGVCAFDYHYETYSTNSKGHRQTHHHHFSAVLVNSGLPLEPLLIRSEGAMDRIAQFVGFDDIDFESAEFSREFFVKAPDPKWAYHVIHGRTITFLLEQPRYEVEMAGPWVMARRSRLLAPADFGRALAVVEGILDRLPRYLLRELKGEDA